MPTFTWPFPLFIDLYHYSFSSVLSLMSIIYIFPHFPCLFLFYNLLNYFVLFLITKSLFLFYCLVNKILSYYFSVWMKGCYLLHTNLLSVMIPKNIQYFLSPPIISMLYFLLKGSFSLFSRLIFYQMTPQLYNNIDVSKRSIPYVYFSSLLCTLYKLFILQDMRKSCWPPFGIKFKKLLPRRLTPNFGHR